MYFHMTIQKEPAKLDNKNIGNTFTNHLNPISNDQVND